MIENVAGFLGREGKSRVGEFMGMRECEWEEFFERIKGDNGAYFRDGGVNFVDLMEFRREIDTTIENTFIFQVWTYFVVIDVQMRVIIN